MSELAVLDARAAFVDVGSEKMHVSIGGGPPRVFGTVTLELHALRDYLLENQVGSVAMEATGVYWLPLYGVLEAAGLAIVYDAETILTHNEGSTRQNRPLREQEVRDRQRFIRQWGRLLVNDPYYPADLTLRDDSLAFLTAYDR